MADGYPAFEAVTGRVTDYSAGSQVRSADLNEIQDREQTLSENMDELAGVVPLSFTGTGNRSDSPAPDTYGGWTVWCEKATNGTTEVVLDTSRDYRDRFVLVTGSYFTDTDDLPGGASDEDCANTHNPLGAEDVHGLIYTQSGGTGSAAPRLRISIAIGGSDSNDLYARSTDGALCMKKAGHASGTNVTYVLCIQVSPTQNHV